MLYFYKPIVHPIQNLHKYMHHFFEQLFLESSKVYDPKTHLHFEFIDIASAYKEQIEDRLISVFNVYMNLKQQAEKQLVQQAYNNNNNIEGICDKTVRPYKFSELPEAIQEPLKGLYNSTGVLYKMLTSKDAYQPIKNKCGSLKGHFEKFRETNTLSVCPFCGMENLITEYEDGKNEYDHYISKGDYPFCSINFANLVPTCDYCNKGGNKGTKDIPFIPKSKPQVQEEIYFPFSFAYPNHEIVLTINSNNTDLSDVNSWALKIDCIPATNNLKKERWVEIYSIESRYKGKLAKDSYDWKDFIINEYNKRCKKRGDRFEDFKEDIMDRFKDYKKWNNGIHMKTFDEFIMNNPDCESFLSGQLVI